jgi:hypothetical protein
MERLSHRILLDQRALNVPIHQRIRGADVEVMVPPQDFPDALWCFFDKTHHAYAIVFKYVSNSAEPLFPITSPRGTTFLIGSESRRLHQIIIPQSGDTTGGDIHDYLDHAIRASLEELTQMATTTTAPPWAPMHGQNLRAGNYRAARAAIDFNRDEIIRFLQPR